MTFQWAGITPTRNILETEPAAASLTPWTLHAVGDSKPFLTAIRKARGTATTTTPATIPAKFTNTFIGF